MTDIILSVLELSRGEEQGAEFNRGSRDGASWAYSDKEWGIERPILKEEEEGYEMTPYQRGFYSAYFDIMVKGKG